MKIIFKNGHEEEVPYEVAKLLRDNLLKGCADFQCFSDENNKVFLIVNLKEIVCVRGK
jgi:hypothetical protein